MALCPPHAHSDLQNFSLKSKMFLWAAFLNIFQLFEYCRGAQFSLEKIFMSVIFSLASRNQTTIAVNNNFRGPKDGPRKSSSRIVKVFF